MVNLKASRNRKGLLAFLLNSKNMHYASIVDMFAICRTTLKLYRNSCSFANLAVKCNLGFMELNGVLYN